MKILIVDDHAITRQGLRQVLEGEFAENVIVEAANGTKGLQAFRQENFDVVIMDIGLPDKMGLEILKEMKDFKPAIPVVILSLHSEEQYAIRALKYGASAYLTKETAPEELLTAIKKVTAGSRYVSAYLGEFLAGLQASDPPSSPLELLSDRELEVLRLIGKGKTVSEIASHLGLSVKTISTYRARLLEKLNLRTTPKLIRYALDHNLVT